MNNTTNSLNGDLFKEISESQQKSLRKIFFTCLKEIPRDIVIKALKEKKFIERDWLKNGNKYVERKL